MQPQKIRELPRRIVTRAKNLTPKQKKSLYIGGGLLALAIVCIGAGTVIGKNSADSEAQRFGRELDGYTSKLKATNGSISQLKPIVSSPPTLQGSAFGWLSGDYKRAQAKQEILDVHQKNVFRFVGEFKQPTFDEKLAEAMSTFRTRMNNNAPQTTERLSRSIFDVESVKKTALLSSKSRLDVAYKDLKTDVQAIDFGTYGERGKSYMLSIIDSAMELERAYATNVKAADTYADMRGLNLRHAMQTRFPQYDPKYGLAAIYGMNQLPANVHAPAILSLEYSLQQVGDDDPSEARERAVATLYGYTAARNTPATADSGSITLNRLGIATYSLSKLAAELKDSEDSELKTRVDTARQAYESLPYGKEANDIPSGLSRITALSTINGGLSAFDGYSDLIADLKNASVSDKRINGARVDFKAYDTIRTFAVSAYPSALFPSEVSAYKKALDVCIDDYLENHRAAEKVLETQLKLGQKVVGYKKEVRSIERSGSTDTTRLNQIKADVAKAEQERIRLDESLKPANEKLQKDIAACGPDLKTASDTLNAKLTDLPANNKRANSLARDVYQNL